MATRSGSGKAAAGGRGGKAAATVVKSPAGDDATLAAVRELAEVLDEYSLSEVTVERAGTTITLRRGGTVAPGFAFAAAGAAPAAAAGSAAPAAAAAPVDNHHVVTSPFVGTFYRRPNPDAPTYVQVGERVERGKVLCLVEAMKLMNEIEADLGGTIIEALVEDGAPVEFGQPLFKIGK